MTRLKILFINTVIFLGAIAIAVLQWPRAREAIGNADDIGGVILLEVLIAGIPIVVWAGLAHYFLSWLLMRPGEIEDYRGQQEIARLPQETRSVQQRQHDLLE